MKHLLIILISFLLLSSPVIGQETGVYTFMKVLMVFFGKNLEIKKLTQFIKEMLRMEDRMVLVLLLSLMEESMLVKTRVVFQMVKEQ